jgi:dihydrofolate synthase/folylpolyglutamate synthase
MYQRDGKAAYKANLDNTIALDNHLSAPHKQYPTIHIAGTNGKGSTCHMLASILQEAGYKVGLYTSPHLKDFRERIKVNGACCSEQFVIDFTEKHQEFFKEHRLSFFEMTVGMAFQYFKEEQVDIAVIETGLGGRLDSTNIITPLITGITNIDYDHTAILGKTLIKITGEKAGIIKSGVPVIVGEQRGFLKSRFRESALNKNAPIEFIDHRKQALQTDLKGNYQKANALMAVKIIETLKSESSFSVHDAQIKKGLLNVVKNTNLRGRYEVLQESPKVICDTAHNKAGIKLLISQINKESFKNLHIVIGVVSDKEVGEVLNLMPSNATYYISKPDIPRGMQIEVLSSFMKLAGLNHTSYASIREAFITAKSNSVKNDLVLVTGSTFVVAEVI